LLIGPHVAVPAVTGRAEHRVVRPDLNVTVPPPIVPPAELTLAVNVTPWPKVDGLVLLSTVVVVDALLTVWLRDVPVLFDAAKFVLPLKYAVIGCDPAGRLAIGPHVAAPDDTGCAEHTTMSVPSDLNSTVPSGTTMPASEVTVAVNVTPEPYVEGLPSLVTAVVVDPRLNVDACAGGEMIPFASIPKT